MIRFLDKYGFPVEIVEKRPITNIIRVLLYARQVCWVSKKIAASQPIVKPYVPKYSLRTQKEHEAIRASLKIDPKSCDHRKGGLARKGWAPRFGPPDYNVSTFTFVNGRIRIRCNSCGDYAYKGDPRYEYFESLVYQSSNSAASSERVIFIAHFSDGRTEHFRTKEEVLAKYPNWDGKIR